MPSPSYDYVLFDPSGNTTAIVINQADRADYIDIAKRIMSLSGAEQVGFASAQNSPLSRGRLEMMGGEFCGNASRCFAFWLALNNPSTLCEKSRGINIEVSGHNGVLSATVEDTGEPGTCRVAIGMPLPYLIDHGKTSKFGNYSLVAFEGITHTVLWDKKADKSLVPCVMELAGEYAKECCGLLFTDIESYSMTPLVYVEQTNSLIFEGSCGSGTVAVACAVADKAKKSARLELIEPCGRLVADVTYEENHITRASLSGDIRYLSRGTIALAD